MNRAIRTIIFLFTFSLAYAILRYAVFGDVEWSHLPLYIFNKALALTGFFLLILSALTYLFRSAEGSHPDTYYLEREQVGKGSFLLIVSHIFISLIILSPAYYQKFYHSDGGMNLKGELSMFFGVAGLIFMWLTNRYFKGFRTDVPNSSRPGIHVPLIRWAILTSTLHVAVMGYASWFDPAAWPGYLPPITLVAMIGFLAWLILAIKPGKKRSSIEA